MALQDVASRECIFTQPTSIRTYAGVWIQISSSGSKSPLGTYALEDGASDVSHADNSCYNEGKETFLRRLLLALEHLSGYLDLRQEQLRGAQQHLGVFLDVLAIRPRA